MPCTIKPCSIALSKVGGGYAEDLFFSPPEITSLSKLSNYAAFANHNFSQDVLNISLSFYNDILECKLATNYSKNT